MSRPANRTYSRKAPGKDSRKPLRTFNSAPVLSSGVNVKTSDDTDSFDLFVEKSTKAIEGEKKKKQKAWSPSLFSDNEDDNDSFSPTPVLRYGGVSRAGGGIGSSAASAKDDRFDKLFTSGPIRGRTSVVKGKSNPSPPSWVSSSKEYFSCDSSVEKENSSSSEAGLFSSFSQRLDLLGQDKDKPATASAKNKTSEQPRKPKKKANVLAVPVIGKKTSDRGFSDETLNYVASGLGAISLNESASASYDVFTSPVVATTTVDDQAMTKMAKGETIEEEETKEVEPKFSPAIGQAQATSTPNLVKVRLSVAESLLQSPLNIGMASDLIHRKGGKRWRRSSMAPALAPPAASAALLALDPELNGGTTAACTPTSRRATIMIGSRKKPSSGGGPISSICQDSLRRRRQTTVGAFFQDSAVKCLDDFDEREEDDLVLHTPSKIFPSSPSTMLLPPPALSSQNTQKCPHPAAAAASAAAATPATQSFSSLSDVDKVLSRCTSSQILPLEDLYPPERLWQSRKLGEGAFGEVFLLPSANDNEDSVVVKIVPVGGHVLVNGQPQMKHIDMLAEIIISTELSKLSSTTSKRAEQLEAARLAGDAIDDNAEAKAPGFLTVLNCYLTEGRYPNDLLAKWDDYHVQKVSENDRPDDSLFGQDEAIAELQQFVVLELKNSGQDLEGVTLANASQGWAVFQQVAHALAIAEKLLAFEHRDLHWGNVLIQTCTEKHILFGHASETFKVETQGVRATIIDFSLSRLSLPTDDDDNIIYNNLTEDPDLFKSEGDYQFDIYRMMRSHTNNEWEKFHPKTNVMWLHYMLDKLTSEVLYKNKKSKAHASALGKMRHVKNSFLQFDSAYAYITATSTSASAKGSTTSIE